MVFPTSDHGCQHRRELNLAGFLARSAVNGPGIRAVVWVQGCPLRCKGCFNQAFQPFSPANVVSADEIAGRILATQGIDGVTFSGGEPFFQADALAVVGEQVREQGYTVVTYTGYRYEHLLTAGDPGWDRLLGATDLLIDGPYIEALAGDDPHTGSSNQRLISLSGRIPRDTPGNQDHCRMIEFSIAPDGMTTVTGFPGQDLVRQVSTGSRGG